MEKNAYVNENTMFMERSVLQIFYPKLTYTFDEVPLKQNLHYIFPGIWQVDLNIYMEESRRKIGRRVALGDMKAHQTV